MIIDLLLYPLTLVVTFLHELGHVLGAIITGGSAIALQVNSDGSGVATTSGGIREVVVAGGYLGSIIFGNLILRVGLLHPKMSKVLLGLFGLVMIGSGILLPSTLTSTVFTIATGTVFIFLSNMHYRISNIVVVLIGLYSVVYILRDYNVGPTSDLSTFAGILPAFVWMYIWLIVALGITIFNIISIVKKPNV